MSGDIVETLRRLCSAHGSIAEAIKGKGVEVPAGSGFEDFPGLIAKISASGETPVPPEEGGEFPAEPTGYILIDTYTSSGTFTAPEDGWYQIEVHGASGNGGTSAPHDYDDPDDEGMQDVKIFEAAGGGGSGYVCSRVCLKKGDTVVYVVGAVGLNSTATVNSSVTGESYTQLVVTPGGNGGSGNISTRRGGAAGAGGVGSGGNYSNLQGSAGEQGNTLGFKKLTIEEGDSWGTTAKKGGTPGHGEGNTGGRGAYYGISTIGNTNHISGEAGKPGFVKISRGNTNVA